MNNAEIINIRLEIVAYSEYKLWMGIDETGSYLARKKLALKKLKALFGEHLKVGKNSVLNRLNNAEAAMVAQIDHHDIEPLLAIKKVIEFLRLVPIKPEATLASCA